MDEWPNAVRVLHLQGGLRVSNELEPTATLGPRADGTGIEYQISGYPELIRRTRSLTKLVVVGCDFMVDTDQLQGRRDPDWRPLIQPVDGDLWPARGTAQLWSETANGARQAGRMDVFEKARHVRAHLESSSLALNFLSEAYSRHLFATCEADKFKPGVFVSGRFSSHVEFLAHAFLSEMSSLRDHLAWFAAQIVLGIKANSLNRFRSHAGFKKSDNPLIGVMRDAWGTDEAHGWLRTFTDYRNLLVHNVPLTEISSAVGMYHSIHETEALGPLPQVSLRLPENPAQLIEKSKAGPIAESFDAWLENIQEGVRTSGPDVLVYGHETLTRMFELARVVAKFSPTIAAPVVITEDDIIEFEWRAP